MIGRGRGRALMARISGLNLSDSDSESSDASASDLSSSRLSGHSHSSKQSTHETSGTSQPSELSSASGSSQFEATGPEEGHSSKSRPVRGMSGRGRLKSTLMRSYGQEFDSDSDTTTSSDTQGTLSFMPKKYRSYL